MNHRPPALAPATAPHLNLPDHARILVVKLAGLGDVLLTMPAVRALRHSYPRARIDLLVDTCAEPLVRDSPHLDHVLALDMPRFDTPRAVLQSPQRLVRLWRLACQLRGARYDALLLCHHLTLSSGRLKHRLLLLVANPGLRIGLDNGHGTFLDICVPDQGFGALHEAMYSQALAQVLIPWRIADRNGPSLADLGWAAPPDVSAVDRAPVPHDLRIALHPGSGSYSVARRWPLARYVELAAALHARFNAQLVLIAGEDEMHLAAAMRSALGTPSWLEMPAAQRPLREVACHLARCDLFVGNDAFPTHLAAAAGIPVVAIFGLSNHLAWHPLSPAGAPAGLVVRRSLPCSPCFYVGHGLGTPQGCAHRACLTELGVEAVLAQVRQALAPSPYC